MTRRAGGPCKRCAFRPLIGTRFHVTGTEKHLSEMATSDYCLCPRGEAASAKRVFDAIASGCIPVILADEFDWPYAGPYAGPSSAPAAAAVQAEAAGSPLLAADAPFAARARATLLPPVDPTSFSLHVSEREAERNATRLIRALERMPRHRTDALVSLST